MKCKAIWDLMNSDKGMNLMVNLYSRYQDEMEYEDIKDYLAPIKKMAPSAERMTKRPFGFVAKADDGEIKVFLKRRGSYLVLCAETKVKKATA